MEPTDLLHRQLCGYAQGMAVPLHMPGHKRRLSPVPGLPVDWDVTEVPGTDDLHAAEGILAEAMARTAALYGAARTWYLVNGSTCGLLAGIRALAPAGSTVVAARNCHKSVFHAVELGGLHVRWLLPQPVPQFGIWGSVDPGAVAQALEACPRAACVIVTSPNYEGVVSDIAAIARICHAHGVPLLVDEAHGAHLGLPCSAGFPAGALQSGADVVVQSAHKMLPSLTQTAWMHLGRQAPAGLAGELERQLDVFETSSPSYLLMASLDGCTGLLRERGAALFTAWRQRLDAFYARAAAFGRVRVLGASPEGLPAPVFAFDRGKLLMDARGLGLTGCELAAALRGRFSIETEMAVGGNALGMTSPCDAPDALERLAGALETLEKEAPPLPAAAARAAVPLSVPVPGPVRCTIAEALAAPSRALAPQQAAGRTAAEYIWAYPPGVPLAAPGEELTPQLLAAFRTLRAAGVRLYHSREKNGGIQCLDG